jgi:hypothetical protein
LGWVDVNQPKKLKGTVSVNLSGHDMGASYVSGHRLHLCRTNYKEIIFIHCRERKYIFSLINPFIIDLLKTIKK